MSKVKELAHGEFLCKTLWKFKTLSLFTDLTINCSDGPVYVHKAVIFRIFNAWRIGLEDLAIVDVLLLPDVDTAEVNAALKRVYLEFDLTKLADLILVKKETNLREENSFECDEDLFHESVKVKTEEVVECKNNLKNYPNEKEIKTFNDDFLAFSTPNEEKSNKRKVGRPKGKRDTSKRKIYTFECKDCDIKFKGRLAFKKHLQNYHSDIKKENNAQTIIGPIFCPYCGKVLSNVYNFNVHIALVHREMAFYHPEIIFKKNCKDCTEKFFNGQDLDKHMRAVHGKVHRTFKCNFCQERLLDKPSLRAHRLSLHKDQLAESGLSGLVKNIPCPYCENKYKANNEVKRHIASVHSDKLDLHPEIELNYSCEVCQARFFEKHNLLNHNAKIHGEEFNCDLCDKTFTNKSSKHSHMNVAHKNEEHKCEECHKVCKSKPALRIHMRKVHSFEPLYKFPCTHCKQGAQTKQGLKKHIEDNHQGKQYMCSFCSDMFHDKQGRGLHERRMHAEKTLPCDQCDKKFSLTHDLQRHIRIVHIKERDLVCPICGEDFCSSNQESFKCHVNRHNDNRPFTCHICGQSYLTNRDLKKHQNVHTLPYKCKLCEKSFSAKGILDDHTRKHAGEKVGCRFNCGCFYLDRRNRDRHEKSCVENKMKGSSWGVQNKHEHGDNKIV